ncbi:EutP/PduV family microcompartment system protein [Caniella muris]|uniref:EutP/PduV family microcompartment system protein n=1 Tax=Caniella muris TaxID=2941502 RepID=UPI00203D22C8|nr:EutP/PduV family microcompartment system protein [Caniella muris]
MAGADPRSAAWVADLVEGSPTLRPERQDCLFRDRTILVPGRYVESHWMHGTLLMLAQNQAGAMVLVENARNPWGRWSAGLARATTVPSLGVVAAAGSDVAGTARAERSLWEAGCDAVVQLPVDDADAAGLLGDWAASQGLRPRHPWDGMREEGGVPCTM